MIRPTYKVALFFLLVILPDALLAEKIKIGVVVALTGDAASLGQDLKNAIVFANEQLGNNKYELIIEDDRCDSKTSTAVAKKLTTVDRIDYALGFACNTTLIATASIYARAKVPVISACATSGDIKDLGENIFRLFPSDVYAANLLAEYLSKQEHQKLAILTEQDQYPLLMERSMRKKLKELGSKTLVESQEFLHRDSDFKSVISKVIHSGADALFLNSNTDVSFATIYKQLRALRFTGQVYGAYFPASVTLRQQLGKDLDGVIFSNSLSEDQLIQPKWQAMYQNFLKQVGGSKSGLPIGLVALESFRVLDKALQDSTDVGTYLKTQTINDGLLPSYHFEPGGAVAGFKFVMQKIENGEVVDLQ